MSYILHKQLISGQNPQGLYFFKSFGIQNIYIYIYILYYVKLCYILLYCIVLYYIALY